MRNRPAIRVRDWAKLAGIGLATAALMAFIGGSWFYWRLKESLPVIDGVGRVPGLTAPVTIERDGQGVVTVRGANYADVAEALGFAHGQDRFFEMDLERRRAAGELSALFGKGTLAFDREARIHAFRRLAEEDFRRASPEVQAILTAYAKGVNAGVGSLKAKPFEYILLAADPEPWRPEDAFLVDYSMALALDDPEGAFQRGQADVLEAFGREALDFFSPEVGPTDAALDGTTAGLPPVPPKGVVDVHPRAAPAIEAAPPGGSNAFAVAGRFTASGAGLVANDMHLKLSVPNIWYRASLVWPGHRVTGITLPGAPAVIAGSNGHIAWGFTDSFAATGDLIAVTPVEEGYYRGPGGTILALEKRVASIAVRGSDPATATTSWTVWGPVVGTDAMGRLLVYHWALDQPDAVDFGLVGFYDARTTDEALALAHGLRLPSLNLVVADAAGKIGWTVVGVLPRRVGYDGRVPVAWEFGDRGWNGWVPPNEVPTVSGRPYLWSANQRMVGGNALRLLGDSGYFPPARAAQIRDDLKRLVDGARKVSEPDLLAVQLDDRALFLEKWRELALASVPEVFAPAGSDRAKFRAELLDWDARADTGSVGYTLVRAFRTQVAHLVLDPLFARVQAQDPDFQWTGLHYEDGLWALVQQRPGYLLNPRFQSWGELLLTAADDAIRELKREGYSVDGARWGLLNRLVMIHPFSRVLPHWLTFWLDLPAVEMPGDLDVPRVQRLDYGATERFVVSPGHEAEGIFEMPAGQSGHPLSPFYRDEETAWVRGEPTPFLPGPARHRLVLSPDRH